MRLAFLALAVFAASAPAAARKLPELRVAMVSYGETPAREIRELEPLARRLEAAARGRASLSFAFGSYGDVASWVEQGKVDAAVVTPGVLGYLVHRSTENARASWRYLGSEKIPADNHAACAVPVDSPLKTLGDVKAAQASGGVQFLFVDLLSVSGRILPQMALERAGIQVAPDDVLYTSSHGTSLQTLLAERSDKPRVACVWERVLGDKANAGRFRVFDLPELRETPAPPDSLLAVGDSPATKILEKAVVGMRAGMEPAAPWRERAMEVWRSYEHVEEQGGRHFLSRTSLDGLASLLVAHKSIYGTEPRLAVVFSGGGAKCSYQVGAVRAILERLEK